MLTVFVRLVTQQFNTDSMVGLTLTCSCLCSSSKEVPRADRDKIAASNARLGSEHLPLAIDEDGKCHR